MTESIFRLRSMIRPRSRSATRMPSPCVSGGTTWVPSRETIAVMQPPCNPRRSFLDRKAALARLLRDTEAGIVLNEHVAVDGPTVFARACRLGAEGIVSKRVDGTHRSGPCPVWIKVRNPASIAVQQERSEK